MLAQLSLFIVGLLLLLSGGEALVRGSSAIAQSLGVAPVVIGMTVVAFGTSAPEFVVALIGAISGAQGVAFGNLIGANIVNIGFILGVAALFSPLIVHRTIVTREIPMLILAMAAVVVLSSDEIFGSAPNRLVRGDGLVLCLLFGVFLYYTVLSLQKSDGDEFQNAAKELGWRLKTKALFLPITLVLVGLAGLTIGGNLLVDSAVDMAKRLGMSPATIGLTIVSIGTTMPELTTSILAVRKGQSDLAVGNIVGSNIFNVLFVLGIASTISPIDLPPVGPVVLIIATLFSCLLLVLVYTHKRQIVRYEGGLLLTLFVGYMVWIVLAAR